MMNREFYAEMREIIREHGRHILGVFNCEDTTGPEFAYTIGNHDKGLPELLVIGTPKGGFLNDLSLIMINRGEQFADGEIVDIGGRFPVKVVDANPAVRDEFTIQAGQYYGTEDYAVQQVLIPDREGRFPGDPNCDEPYKSFGPRQVS
jgi:hypothetical protein